MMGFPGETDQKNRRKKHYFEWSTESISNRDEQRLTFGRIGLGDEKSVKQLLVSTISDL